jgi:hypothetical protein
MPTPLTAEQRLAKAQRTADRAGVAAAEAQGDADAVDVRVDDVLSGVEVFDQLNVDGTDVAPFLGRTDGSAVSDPAAVPQTAIEAQVRAAVGAAAPLSYNSGTGQFGWSGTKADVGLANVDNTSDAAKPVSTAQQTALDLKAPLASPALTGSPTAPTQLAADNSTKVATTAFVQAVVQALIDLAPGTLDTLNELAAALGDDPDFAGTVTTALATKLVKSANLSDLTDASVARSNLGVAIGTDVQAYDPDLTAFAGKTAPLDAVVGTTDAQTLTNKTLTSPAITTPTGIVKGDVGLGNVTNESKATMFASPLFTGAVGVNRAAPSGVCFRIQDTTDDVGIDYVRTSSTEMALLAVDRSAGVYRNWLLAGTRIAFRYEGGTEYLLVTSTGLSAVLTTYADNAAAITGGLAATALYKTATGEVRVVV